MKRGKEMRGEEGEGDGMKRGRKKAFHRLYQTVPL